MTASQFSISARTSNLLHIVFNRSWQIVMNHALDIRFVNTHRIGDCAAQNANLILAKLLLNVVSLLVCFASVIRR